MTATPYKPWRTRPDQQDAYYRFREWMWELKATRGCDRCGYREHPVALEWDHRPEEVKRFGISSSWTRRREVLLEELGKCDLLCANCHRVITHERRTWSNPLAANRVESESAPSLFDVAEGE